MSITIKVTKEDIAKGEPGSAYACPIALAVRRIFPGHHNVRVCDYIDIGTANMRLRYRMPVEAMRFIRGFDRYSQSIIPYDFEFDITLTD